VPYNGILPDRYIGADDRITDIAMLCNTHRRNDNGIVIIEFTLKIFGITLQKNRICLKEISFPAAVEPVADFKSAHLLPLR
jgi:hypothetical protein